MDFSFLVLVPVFGRGTYVFFLEPLATMMICAVMYAINNNNNNNRRLVTLAEHTSDHGRQTNSSTEDVGGS